MTQRVRITIVGFPVAFSSPFSAHPFRLSLRSVCVCIFAAFRPAAAALQRRHAETALDDRSSPSVSSNSLPPRGEREREREKSFTPPPLDGGSCCGPTTSHFSFRHRWPCLIHQLTQIWSFRRCPRVVNIGHVTRRSRSQGGRRPSWEGSFLAEAIPPDPVLDPVPPPHY